ncbi:MAG: N-acetylmuramoyl-L-alanine amidase [Candidatus Eremiobacteraeota bacterium]|nr:N-acetylmuramoyl-L-alanine amidase [Candidatus Eremiobacteraeota bacterium]
MTRHRACVLTVLAAAMVCSLAAPHTAAARGIGLLVSPNASHVFVAGRDVRFENLGSAHGEPVVRVDDAGLRSMLNVLGARLAWQPGTRYAALTRADGVLITFTVGSNALSLGDSSIALSSPPFYQDNAFYLPLLPLAQALGLDVRRFSGGYAFVPQIISAQRRIGLRRTVLEIRGSAPLTWRTAYAGKRGRITLTLQFPGFANAARQKIWMGGRDARVATATESGAPGFPVTTFAIDVQRGVHFASHRMPGGAALDLILARDQNDLRLAAVVAAPSVVLNRPTAAPSRPSAAPSRQPAQPLNASTPPPSSVPTAQPLPSDQSHTPTGDGSSQPGESPMPESSADQGTVQPSPGTSEAPLQKISDAFVTDATDASRVTLIVTGSVSFEWHRLGDPDNRFWVDVHNAELIGPARDLKAKLPMVQSIKLSQHELFPEHVVRVSINPSQPVDVRIGAVEGSPNQLGIEILAAAPPLDAPTSGTGMIDVAARPPHVVASRGRAEPNLIVIDPGHGGNDPGSLNRGAGLVESHLTFAISQRLKADLEHAGWKVVLTRQGDYEVGDPGGNDHQELQARCDIANAAGARLFISVHVNASTSSAPNGVTTYYWKPADRALAQAVEQAAAQLGSVADAGVHRENFYVIHHTVMPAILVETAYLSNAHDAALLAQPAFTNKMADAIARGVNDFTGGPP